MWKKERQKKSLVMVLQVSLGTEKKSDFEVMVFCRCSSTTC